MKEIGTPKPRRLPREEFLSRKFRTLRTPCFSVKIKVNGASYGRIGVVAGKAAGKTSVERSFLKRQARAALFRSVMPGNDVLVIFSSGAGNLTKRNLHLELQRAIRAAQK